jgi:coenzyme PQQ precursor peptide PqqA
MVLTPHNPAIAPMAWTRPKLREICIAMEINGYFTGQL